MVEEECLVTGQKRWRPAMEKVYVEATAFGRCSTNDPLGE
jgi:hypothetical protein